MRNLAAAVLVVLIWPSSAGADGDVFQRAVGFALTGNDNAIVEVIDRENCIFGIGNQTFHLNNVQTDRIFIREWKRMTMQGKEVYDTIELHGSSTVYEVTTPGMRESPGEENDPLWRMLRKDRPELFLPGHTALNQHEITVVTNEFDRLIRAWRYIYANGCHGQKSEF